MKKFLQEYGFTIIAAIVIITLVAFSSPIGSEIKKQTSNITNSFGQVTEAKIDQIDDWVPDSDISNINKSGVKGDFSKKGNLVTINGVRYKVLSINGYKVKVLSTEPYAYSQYDNRTLKTFGDYSIPEYNGSIVDSKMTEFYNSLPSEIKKAIVETKITQSIYYSSGGTSPDNNFSGQWFSGEKYYLKKMGEVDAGYKKVYLIDLDDAIEYLGDNASPEDVNELFFGERNSVGKTLWLRSARTDGYIFDPYGGNGNMANNNNSTLAHVIYPMFIIDLNLLS